jgi:hypothetical protein
MGNYNVMFFVNGMVNSYYISSERDLLQAYKDSLINKEGFITWDKGIIDCNHVVGITKE